MRNEDEVKNIVYGAIAATFRFSVGEIGPETTASDVNGWDSVSTSRLFFAIEDAVGVELPIEDLLATDNVGELCAAVFRFLGTKKD